MGGRKSKSRIDLRCWNGSQGKKRRDKEEWIFRALSQVSELLTQRRQERERHDVAVWDRLTRVYKLTRKRWCFGLQNAGAKKDRKRILNEQLNESSSMRHIDWRGALLEKARPRRRKLEALPVTCRRTEEWVLTLQQPMLKGGCAGTRIIFDDEVDTCWRFLRSPL